MPKCIHICDHHTIKDKSQKSQFIYIYIYYVTKNLDLNLSRS